MTGGEFVGALVGAVTVWFIVSLMWVEEGPGAALPIGLVLGGIWLALLLETV